jgi:arabinogalactan oligomer / maltooligosaccharide transport system permease protein
MMREQVQTNRSLRSVQVPAIVAPRAVAAPRVKAREQTGHPLSTRRQLGLQAICLFIASTVLFPIVWIFSISLDPRNISRPDGLDLIPPGATLAAYAKVIAQPTANPVSFVQLAINSLEISLIVAVASLTLGSLAAYAFSRMHFRGRTVLMITVLAVLMLPAVASLAPLYVSMNKVAFGTYNLRNSIPGVALAVTSGTLPFAIWNMKGYIDTIPRELEEAAAVDGASKFQIFTKIILPLATPVLAVTALFGFIAGWTEFYFSWTFLDNAKDFTLAMALNGMVGQYAGNTPWSEFAAFAVLVAVPVSVVYLLLQRYIVSGLTVGGVKG